MVLHAGDSGTQSSSVVTPGSSLMRHPDRGAGFYYQKRERYGRASLIETGRSVMLFHMLMADEQLAAHQLLHSALLGQQT